MRELGIGKVAVAIIIAVMLVAGFSAGYVAGSISIRTNAVTVTEKQTITMVKENTVTVTSYETVTTYQRLPPLKLEVKYAKLFSIEYREGYKLLRDALNRTLILVPRGSAPPKDVKGTVIHVPVERIVLLSSTQAGLLVRLAERDPRVLETIKGVAWGKEYNWYLREIKERLDDGRIKDVGSAMSPDYESILSLRPDVMIVYTYPGVPVVSKLEELGIPYAVDNEWLEDTALGRFEWIKFIAAFYDMELEAQEIFTAVEAKVASLKETISRSSPVKVLWFNVWRGVVYAASGDSYVSKAIGELGGEYLFSDLKGAERPTLEELIARAIDADVIVYSSYLVNSIEDILKEVPALANSRAVREGRVYAFTETYWQLGYPYTDEWYADLASILHPDLFSSRELKFFKELT